MSAPIAVTIAGLDPSGGAGIAADLKTFSALGVYGAAVVTALTAQNTKGVFGIHDVPADFIAAQINAVFTDLAVGAVKIGMLGGPAAIDVVAAALDRYRPRNVVLDPVMIASSGQRLLRGDALDRLRDLIARVHVLTPNLPEAAALLGTEPARDEAEMQQQAQKLLALGAGAVLIKGGHGGGAESVDLLVEASGETLRLAAPRIATENTHGSGCTFASADCRRLGQGPAAPGRRARSQSLCHRRDRCRRSARGRWRSRPAASFPGMVVASEARGKLLPLTSSPPFAASLQGELTMLSKLILAAAAATLLAAGEASAAEYEMVNHADIVFAEHDGTKLVGDLYLPKGRSKAPVLVAVHGGGWQVGNKQFYRNWGLFLARAGYAVFAVDYRLGKPGVYPAAVYDVKAAVQFIRAKAGDYDLDPERIGLIGDSAGAHLASLVALAGDQFNTAYRDDANAAVPTSVKCVIGFYGVYDMHAQWTHDLPLRPNDKIVEKFLGASPMQNRRVYFDASPISYATIDRNALRFLLIHGTNDDIVDPETQSGAFLTALTQSGFFVRRIILPGAGHFWSSDPFESEPHSYSAMSIPRMIRFLESSL